MYSTCNIDTDKIHASYTRLNHNHSQFATGLERRSYTIEMKLQFFDQLKVRHFVLHTIATPCSKAQGSNNDQD